MAARSTVTCTGLTYTELLATIPWVGLLPKNHTMTCEWGFTFYGRGKQCKTAARLMYVNLDGSIQHFCHHHLYEAKLSPHYRERGEPGYEEIARNKAWEKRSTIDRRPD